MKTIAIAIVLFIAPMVMSAQNAWASFEDDIDVSSVVVSKNMFKLLSKIDIETNDPETQEFMELVENLDQIKIFTTDKPAIAAKMGTAVTSYLSQGKGLTELMRVKDDGKNIKFYSREGKNENYVSELLMFLNGKENGKDMAVVMSITGNIDLKKISKLTKDLNIPGSDAIKDLENKNKNK